MRSARPVLVLVGLIVALAVVIAGARVLGARSVTRSTEEAEAKLRAAGIANRLTVVNMLDVPVQLTVRDVDPAQWGLTPPNDEPPAGLEGLVVEPQRVSGDATLRPLRIVDGGGDATFTIDVWQFRVGGAGSTTTSSAIGAVPTRSSSLEYCGPVTCFDGYAWFTWQDSPDPSLDVFRRCVEVDRVIGAYVDATGAARPVHALFQCDATAFRSALVLHD